MRVGFISCDLTDVHGWGSYSLHLLQALQQLGLDFVVVSARNASSAGTDLPLIARPLPAVAPAESRILTKQLLAASQIRRLLRDCDVIHSTVEPYAPLTRLIAGRRPCFVTAHGSYIELLTRRRGSGPVYRWALRHSHLICVSRYTARVAQQILPGVQTTAILNGTNADRFAHLPDHQVDKQGPTVLAVGAVKPRKGTLELVRAMAQVRQQVPQAQCVIIGQFDPADAYAQRVEAEIRDLGLAQQVHLLGEVDKSTLLAWYGAADLFVLPSINVDRKFEGFGLVYLEASAAGLPVIGTTDCGAEDAIEDGVTGLLVPQSAVTAALPDAIISLLQDPQRAKQMGAAGRALARRHTWKHTAEQVIDCYQQALA